MTRPPMDPVNDIPAKRCELCAFWRELPPERQESPMSSYGARWATGGLCHRFPKTHSKMATSWCGEFQDGAA